MKTFCLILLTFLCWNASQAQSIAYKKVTNPNLVYVLNNLEQFARYTNNNDLFVNVFNVSDPSGSAGNESCDITNSLYIAVSEDGEFPEQHVYRLTSLYDPKFIRWVKASDGPQMIFSYGAADKRKIAKVTVKLRELKIH